jgi:hypothetical protein
VNPPGPRAGGRYASTTAPAAEWMGIWLMMVEAR